MFKKHENWLERYYIIELGFGWFVALGRYR